LQIAMGAIGVRMRRRQMGDDRRAQGASGQRRDFQAGRGLAADRTRGQAGGADTAIQTSRAGELLVNELEEKKADFTQRAGREFADVSNFQRDRALTMGERYGCIDS
jgi:hypothetical protein